MVMATPLKRVLSPWSEVLACTRPNSGMPLSLASSHDGLPRAAAERASKGGCDVAWLELHQ